ncbi:hypothetical protein ACQJBY_048247 [Aegilops geniculata]
MESSRYLLLLLIGLLVAPYTVGEPCDSWHWAYLTSVFCISKEHDSILACCEVLKSIVNISLTEDPLCMCSLTAEPPFISTGLFIDELVDKYIACGGDRGKDTQALSDECQGQPLPLSELQDGSSSTDQHKVSLAPAPLP